MNQPTNRVIFRQSNRLLNRPRNLHLNRHISRLLNQQGSRNRYQQGSPPCNLGDILRPNPHHSLHCSHRECLRYNLVDSRQLLRLCNQRSNQVPNQQDSLLRRRQRSHLNTLLIVPRTNQLVIQLFNHPLVHPSNQRFNP